MGFPRQEYWNGLPFPSPGNLPDPGIKPVSSVLMGRFFTTEPPGKPKRSLPHFYYIICSVCQSFLQPHGLQHTRLPRPSPSPGVCPSSCSWDRWCCPLSSPSDAIFSFCPQSFPASVSFPVSQFFTSVGQSIWASASASFLPMNIQAWYPLGLTGFISLLSRDSSLVSDFGIRL